MVAMLARIGKAASALFTGRMQVSGLTAGSADRTILQSSRTEPGRAVLSASSWWGGLVRSAAPPGSSSARAGSDTRRPASAPDSFDPPPAPAPAGARAAVRNRWFGLFPALFCLPLWFDFAVSAQAQQSITDLVQMSRTTRAVAEFSPTPSMRAIVEIGDGLTPVSWARTINYTLGGTADLGSGKDYTIEGCTSSPCSVHLRANTHSVPIVLVMNNDGLDEDEETIVITLQDGSGYTVNQDRKTSTISIRDDDTRGLTFHRRWPDVREGGSDTMTVRLSSQPTAPVTVTIVSNNPDVTVNPSTLTFPPSGSDRWSKERTITVAAAQDDDAVDDMATLVYTTTGGDYGGVNALRIERTVRVDDDDPRTTPGSQGPTISLTGGAAVTEGEAASFTVNASPAPAARLTVNIEVVEHPGQDFVAASEERVRTVTLNAGATSATFSVPTVNDGTDEDDGYVQALVRDGTGYVAGGGSDVPVRDDDDSTPAVNFASAASSAAEGGGTHRVGVDLTEPAPSGGLALNYNVTGSATAGSGNDYTIQGSGTLSVAAGATAATILVAIHDDRANESAETVVLTLAGGTGYTLGSPGVHTLTITDNDAPPPNTPGLVISQQNALGVPEGGTGRYTVKLATAPTGTVTVSIASDNADVTVNPAPLTFHASGSSELWSSAQTVTVSARQDSDAVDDTATLTHTASGGGYGSVTAASITVEVDDDDSPREPQTTTPVVGIAGGGAITEGGTARFTVTARPAPASSVTVPIQVDSGNIGVESGQDGLRTVTIGTTGTATLTVTTTVDDAVDAVGRITSTVQAGTDYSVAAASVASVRVVTPGAQSAPVAWLVRFGRSVAEQVLDGIKGRMAAVRSAGFTGSIGGSALGFGPRAGPGAGPTAGADETGVAPASAPASADFLAGGGTVPAARPPLSERDRKFGPGPAAGLSRTLTGQELMPGSRFTLTGERDASGGSVAFWGRAAQSGFDGREGRLSLDGKAVTGMLGADYARDRWLVGVALTQSDGEGEYRGGNAGSGSGSDGDIETTLTAAVPYASLQISERLELWGALGHGAGEVVLKPESGGVLESEISWTMASLGLRGDVLAPHAEGPALALVSDMLWARTTSDKAHELAASDSEVTRLRLGLEGSWPQALRKGGTPGSGSGASVTPRLAAGLRHDDGDAESGFGVELGGGLAWVDPRLGLSLDLSGRRLVTHDADGMEDEGFAASVAFDPDPATERGPSLAVRQETGGASSGGLDALFETASPSARTGSENDTRWSAEAAWGFPAISQRFTGSPHVGLGVATGARDYTLGWRLEPVAGAPAVSLGALATRRESDAAAPEHTGGLEISARW